MRTKDKEKQINVKGYYSSSDKSISALISCDRQLSTVYILHNTSKSLGSVCDLGQNSRPFSLRSPVNIDLTIADPCEEINRKY